MLETNDIVVSVIIATYNSEKVLERTLKALRRQSFPGEKMEIIVSDGMSSDSTRQIAKKYGCVIIDNLKIEQGNAKILGLQAAKGRYVVFVDSDEVLERPDAIQKTINAFQSEKECHYAICSGYKKPNNYPSLSGYISDFGDPFSFFVYRCPKDYRFYSRFLRKHYEIRKDKKDYFVFKCDLSKHFILNEGGCGGSVMDMDYFDKHFPECRTNISALYHSFYLMCERGEVYTIYIKNDPLVHYSSDTVSRYMKKLKWRVCNNIHFREKGQEVFSGRERFRNGSHFMKFLFIPYSFSLVIPFFHSLPYFISRKNASYLLHGFFSLYISVQILFQYAMKIIGKTPDFVAYGSKKKISGNHRDEE